MWPFNLTTPLKTEDADRFSEGSVLFWDFQPCLKQRISIINAESFSSSLLAFPRVPQISSGTLDTAVVAGCAALSLLLPSDISDNKYEICQHR